MILEIWRGLDGAPYFNAIHFTFSAGAALGPILAAPFLGSTNRNDEGNTSLSLNSTNHYEEETETDSNIQYLFPLIAFFTAITGLGFLYYGIR